MRAQIEKRKDERRDKCAPTTITYEEIMSFLTTFEDGIIFNTNHTVSVMLNSTQMFYNFTFQINYIYMCLHCYILIF